MDCLTSLLALGLLAVYHLVVAILRACGLNVRP